jgi:hypothetical protein
MKAFLLRALLVVICLATLTSAQGQAPKPDPQVGQLSSLLAGIWTYQGEYKPGPLGPGGKMTGVYTGQTILNGFFFEGREAEKGATGETHSVEIDAYDPANKNFICNIYGDDGSRFSGTATISGNTVTWEGKFFAGGQQIFVKEPFIFAADRMSGTAKAQISMDGKTWTPFFEATFTKAKATVSKATSKK